MARKRASLQGRGSEILMGVRQDEQAGPAAEPESHAGVGVDEPESSLTLAQAPERGPTDLAAEPQDPGDGGQELSPEWRDLLQEEALSASDSTPSALNGDIMPDIDLPLPPLATTPARPSRPTDETPEAASPPVREDIQEAKEPASAPAAVLVQADEVSDDVGGYVESDSVPATAGTTGDAGVLVREPGHGAQVFEHQPDLRPQPEGLPVVTDAAVAFEEPTPPAPMYFESYGAAPSGGAYLPAPKEKPEATDTVMRARLGGLLHQRATVKPSNEDLELDRPKAHEMVIKEIEGHDGGLPSRPREEPEVLEYVGEAQRRALWDESLELYQVVPEALSGDENQARALRLLQEAQEILLEKPRQYDMAKFKVGQVQALVMWRRNVNRWSNTYGWGIVLYEVAWIAVLMLGVLTADRVAEFVTSMAGSVPGIGGLSRLWSAMMWGGLGGVMSAFYSLYWHVAKVRDFDKRYVMWYVVQPVIGLLLGALVHLLIGPGVWNAQKADAQIQTVIGSLFPYAVACIVGFRQRFVLEIIDRVIQVITPSSQPEQELVEETITEEPLDTTE